MILLLKKSPHTTHFIGSIFHAKTLYISPLFSFLRHGDYFLCEKLETNRQKIIELDSILIVLKKPRAKATNERMFEKRYVIIY